MNTALIKLQMNTNLAELTTIKLFIKSQGLITIKAALNV